ncbi:MAG: class I SAM-dependent RNA methyltransferase [Bradymonadales bacterium]|nr:class I SAM-dependent RNA methyltransferase [Bradymonadales bacterium]
MHRTRPSPTKRSDDRGQQPSCGTDPHEGATGEVDLDVEGLDYQARGFARLNDRYVTIPHTLPGDRVRVRVGPFHRGRAFAEVIGHLERSEARVDPQCPHYARCSGCAMRHMSQESERSFKLSAVREILRRYGPPFTLDRPPDWVDAGQRTDHRVRGRLAVRVQGDRVAMGLSSVSLDRAIVDIRDCPAQHPRFRRIAQQVARHLEEHIQQAHKVAAVEIWTSGESSCEPFSPAAQRALVMLQLAEPAVACQLGEPQSCSPVGDSLVAWCRSNQVGLGAFVPGQAAVMACGEPNLSIPLTPRDPHRRLVVPWGSWYHPNPFGADRMAEWVEGLLDGASPGCLLDLCAGVGYLTRRLAWRYQRVLAVDEDYKALASLASTRQPGEVPEIQVRPGRVGTILRKFRRESRHLPSPVHAVVNPMRRPLGEQLRDLAHLGVDRIVYLGPSPVSTARDAEVLSRIGYQLRRAAAINLHPATAQFMLGLELRSTRS